MDVRDSQTRLLRERLEAFQREGMNDDSIPKVQAHFQSGLTESEVAYEDLRQQSESLAEASRALEEERQRYQELFDFAPDGYLITDLDGTIREANRSASQLLEVDTMALVGKPLAVFVEKEQKNVFRSRLGRLRNAAPDAVREWDMTLISRTNQAIPISVTVGLSIRRSGQPQQIRWMIRDMTARHRAQQALSEKTEAFEALFGASPAAIVMLDHLGRVTMWNAAAERLLGWSAWEMLGKPFKLVRVEGETVRDFNLWQEIQRPGWCSRPIETLVLSRHGTRVEVVLTIGTMVDTQSSLRGCVVILSGVDDRDQDDIRQLLHHVHRVREEERRRMAREIHDEMGQAITGLNFDLSRMEADLQQSPALLGKLRGIQRTVGDLMQVVRRVSADLRPPVLDDLGLAAAIEWQTQEFGKRTGIVSEVTLTAEPQLPADTAIALFRIYQEILTNVARHAQASRVTTRFGTEGPHLLLTVADDGVGLPPERWNDPATLGLRGMRERAALIGADIRLEGPGNGTTITVRLPLE